MSRYAEPMARLIEELKKLPGVGTKSAQRFAFHILRSSDEDAAALAEAVQGLKASLRLCSICNNITDVDPCAYCASPVRNQRLVCVVEEPTSIGAIERTRGYTGRLPRAARHTVAAAWRGARPAPREDAAGESGKGEVDEVILATSPDAGRRSHRGLAGFSAAGCAGDGSHASRPEFLREAISNMPMR